MSCFLCCDHGRREYEEILEKWERERRIEREMLWDHRANVKITPTPLWWRWRLFKEWIKELSL